MRAWIVGATLLTTAPVFGEPASEQATGRAGVTVEASLGIGGIRVRCNDQGCPYDLFPAPAYAVSVGGWVSPRVAMEFRAVGVWIDAVLAAPSAQVWITDYLWLGGGVGLDVYYANNHRDAALGFDARVGATLPAGPRNSWTISLEASPSFFHSDTVTLVVGFIGYQYR